MSGQPPVTAHRDVAAFDERAPGYDGGRLGRMHHLIAERVADLAVRLAPHARRILDVGCGTGYLLGVLAARLPDAERLLGIDAAPGMIRVAGQKRTDPRIALVLATAEHLPARSGFDLVVSSTSFDHWRDQRAGLAECARVLRPGGQLVLCDQFSALLVPTLLGDRRGKARTPRRATALVTAAGFAELRWHGVYTVLIKAVTATRP